MLQIEPVFGCTYQCRQCSVGDVPQQELYMDPKALDVRLGELAAAGLFALVPRNNRLSGAWWVRQINYTNRGNPFSHSDLREITRVVRKHFHPVHITSFWNLAGLDCCEDLIKRSEGLDSLVISLDGHHYRGFRRHLLSKSGRTEISREDVLEEIQERLRWGLDAVERHELTLSIRLVGKEPQDERSEEREFFARLFNRVWIEKDRRDIGMVVDRRQRMPRGFDLAPEEAGEMNLLYDCSLTTQIPLLTKST